MSLAWTLAIAVPLLVASWLASALLVHARDRAGRIWAAGILTWAWVTLGMQLLGTLGWLARLPLFGWSAAGLLLLLACRYRLKISKVREGSSLLDQPDLSVAARLALGLTVAACLYYGIPSLLFPVKVVSDGPIYHLYFAARWWKAGRLFRVATPFAESAAPYFPANGDLWFAWLMTCWGGDRLARVGQAPFLLASGWLIAQLATTLGAARSAAMIAACWAVTLFPLLLFSFEANVDTLLVAGYLAGLCGIIRYDRTDRSNRTLVLTGLACGLAWGCKPTGIVFIPPLLALGAVVVCKHSPGAAHAARACLLLCGAALVPCIYWYAGNIALTGNPLYPAHLSILGHTIFQGWYTPAAMQASPYYIPRDHWGALHDILLVVLDPRLAPFWLTATAGAWRIGRPSQPGDRWLWILTALAVGNVLLFWWLIPYRTQQRLMLHGLVLLAIPLARLLTGSTWRLWAAFALLALHLFTPSRWPLANDASRPFWFLTRYIPDPSTAILPLSLRDLVSVAPLRSADLFTGSTVAAGLACGWLWTSARSRVSSLRTTATLACTLACISAVALMALHAFGASYRGYPKFEYLPAWLAVESISPPSGLRVAYSGTGIPYYLMGRDLRNHVEFVNVDEHEGWLMHDYHRAAIERGEPALWPTPRPGWDRMHPDRSAWLRNLGSRQIELLVVAQANPAEGPFNVHDREQFPIERSWADADPVTFPLLHANPKMRVYGVRLPAELATDSRAPGH